MRKAVLVLLFSFVITALLIGDDTGNWRELVKEKKVIQPASDSGEWKFTPQPFPSIESIAAQTPDEVPLYGVYHWAGEYIQFRKDIKAVGWKAYRMGGFEDEKALLMAMEDGIEIMMVLQIGKSFNELRASGKRNAYKSDEEFIQKYLQGIDEFCMKYGPGGTIFNKRPDLAKNPVRYIEIWNEPNFQYMIAEEPDRKKVQKERDTLYAKLLKAAGAFVKKKYPKIMVVGFGAGGAAFDDRRFIGNVHAIDPSIGNYYDILSTHPYTRTPPMADKINSWGTYSVTVGWKAIQDILAKYGYSNKPIWYTEVGWPITTKDGGNFKDRPDSFSAMSAAACVTKMYILAVRLGVKRVHIMSITDADNYNSGFFNRKDGEWRPSAYAAQQLIGLLPKPRIQQAVAEETGGLYAYLFKSDWTGKYSKEVIVAWQEQKSGELSIAVPAGRKVLKLLNMLGGEEKFSVNGNKVQFAGGPFPSYLVLE